MKKVYVDTSDAAEAKREKLNDNVIVAYDIHGDIVGIEVLNPVGLDIDDELVVDYTTEELEEFSPNEEWGIA
tara:strand:- start:403 stop:618 length:216 start_codon:yes stop_codon:yes gene_type:complete